MVKKKRKEKPRHQPVSGSRLETELKFYGCTMDADEFNELLVEMHHNMHPRWNPEQLLYNPTPGVVYCKAIRARAKETLPEEMILRRLRNIQKSGNFAR